MSYKRISPSPVVEGGTGAQTLTGVLTGNGTSAVTANAVTQYTVLLAGASNAVSNVSGVGSANQVLTSNGAGMNPTWQDSPGTDAIKTVNIQVFTSNGTYTPTSGMVYCQIECVGGGGAGGGAKATGVGNFSCGGGGGGGEYARGIFSASDIGASQTVTIGAGASGVLGDTGGTGGTTSVGALITAIGGSGGGSAAAGASPTPDGGAGGTGGSGGDFRSQGQRGWYGYLSTYFGYGGQGAASMYGYGAKYTINLTTANGNNALTSNNYGAGGGGGLNQPSQSATTGGSGSAGVVIVTEYIS